MNRRVIVAINSNDWSILISYKIQEKYRKWNQSKKFLELLNSSIKLFVLLKEKMTWRYEKLYKTNFNNSWKLLRMENFLILSIYLELHFYIINHHTLSTSIQSNKKWLRHHLGFCVRDLGWVRVLLNFNK